MDFGNILLRKELGFRLEESMISWLEDSGVALPYFEFYDSTIIESHLRMGLQRWNFSHFFKQ